MSVCAVAEFFNGLLVVALPGDRAHMDYEVELKFRIDDVTPVLAELASLGAKPLAVESHRDTYFNHPTRDFAQTDEAFRLRTIEAANRLTYKGPRLDQSTKTRQEVEVGCESGADGRHKLTQMLHALGFRDVLTVSKQRTPFALNWQGQATEVLIDEVAGLGTFIELETLADAENWEAARDALWQLAHALNLHRSERRSYLQLLQEG